RQLQNRYQNAAVSGDDADLAVALDNLTARLTDTSARTERLVARVEQLDVAVSQTVQGIGLIRFRAFQDTGGDQSFALALTDGEGNGVVVSSLHGRDAMRLYAKPVQGWHSPKALSGEEEQALAEARARLLGQD
ncbi:MAG: DUF4446 family protein, partial [Anaerolineae bacterium]|nr:DUF4446 family protein [Anaerolineae bacterium]